MSFIKARTQRQEDASTSAGPDHSLLCRVSGCGRRWAVDISHGKVCSLHDDQFTHADRRRTPVPLPTRSAAPQLVPFHQAVPHWQDDKEGDAA